MISVWSLVLLTVCFIPFTSCKNNRTGLMGDEEKLAKELAEAYESENFDLAFATASRIIKNCYEEHAYFEEVIAEELVEEAIRQRIRVLESLEQNEKNDALVLDSITSSLEELGTKAFARACRLAEGKSYAKDQEVAVQDNGELQRLVDSLRKMAEDDVFDSYSDLISETQLDIGFVTSSGDGPKSLRLARTESTSESE